MASLNQCSFIGNLGRDAELKYTPAGDAVAAFSIACTEVWRDKAGQKQERTEWVRCNLWGKPAEAVAEYLTKGKQIYVSGKMQTRQWEKDGEKRYSTEIRADKVVLLGGGQGRAAHDDAAAAEPDAGHRNTAGDAGRRSETVQNEDDDSIPF